MGALACEALVPLLKDIISSSAFTSTIRILAIETARQGKLLDLAPILCDIVKKCSEDQEILVDAGYALVEIAPDQAPTLKAWLNIPEDRDPNNDLKAQALEALWPRYIDLDTLIKCLIPQKNYEQVGKYRMLLRNLPKRLSPDERAKALSVLGAELRKRINRHREGDNKIGSGDNRPLYPSDYFEHFLSEQIEDWKIWPDYADLLEEWLDVFQKANEHIPLHEYEETRKIDRSLEINHELRQELCKCHVIRYWREGGDLNRFFWRISQFFCPRAQDIGFWQKTLETWEREHPALVGIAWDALMTAWRAGDYDPVILEWIEECSERNATLTMLWERDRKCSSQGEDAKRRREDAVKKARKEGERRRIVETVMDNMQNIRRGDENWLTNLNTYLYLMGRSDNDSRGGQAKGIEELFGREVRNAYLEGLQAYWASVKLPALSDYHLINSVPWPILLVLQAVDTWKQDSEARWSDLSAHQRQSALQAGLSELNGFPDWYKELAAEENESTVTLWTKTLDLEVASSQDYLPLLSRLPYSQDIDACRTVALNYLKAHPDMSTKVISPLLRALLKESLEDADLEFLKDVGLRSMEREDEDKGLIFLAAVWRYRQQEIWEWVEEKYLRGPESAASNFVRWVWSIERIHSDFRMDYWPAWVKEETLVLMLPYFLSIDYTSIVNDDPVWFDYLRYDCLNRVAESGKLSVANNIAYLLDQEHMEKHRTILLNILDRCKKALPDDVWCPLAPTELWEVLERDKRPVRTSRDLFDLCVEILDALRIQIQAGESN